MADLCTLIAPLYAHLLTHLTPRSMWGGEMSVNTGISRELSLKYSLISPLNISLLTSHLGERGADQGGETNVNTGISRELSLKYSSAMLNLTSVNQSQLSSNIKD